MFAERTYPVKDPHEYLANEGSGGGWRPPGVARRAEKSARIARPDDLVTPHRETIHMTSLQMTPPTPQGFNVPTAQAVDAEVRQSAPGATLGINAGVAIALATAILMVFIAFAGDAAATIPADPADSAELPVDVGTDTIEIYVVKPGDTLWSIATELAAPGEDVRPLVDALNDIAGGANLDIGDQLVIDHAQIRG